MAGSARIGALHVMLGLDSAQFSAGLAKANAGLDRFTKLAKVGLLAVGTAAATAGAALAVAVKGAIDNADSMGEMAQAVGVSVETLTRYGYAAKMSGSDTEALATSLRKLSQNMLTMAEGTSGPVATAFNALGVSVQNADGSLRASDAVLVDIADKFSRMEDGATKTALAVQLFGRSGAELIPFLNQGRTGLADLTAEADRLGITISTSTANAAGQFNDTLDRLQATAQGVINKVAEGVLPALNEFGDKLADPQFAESAQAIGQAVVDGLKLAVDAINTTVGALQTLGNVMRSIGIYNRGEGFVKFNTEEEAKAILADKLAAGQTQPTGDVYAGIFGDQAAQEITAAAEEVAAAFEPVIVNSQAAAAGASALKAAMSEGKAVFEATRTPAEAYGLEVERLNGLLQQGAIDQETYNRAVAQAQDAFELVGNKAFDVAEGIESAFQGVGSSIYEAFKDGGDVAGSVLDSILGKLDQFASAWFDSVIGNGLSGLFGGGMGLGGQWGVPGGFSGFKGIFGIPGFADGTNFAPGGLALVGERGPELVDLPRGSKVHPNLDALGAGSRINVQTNIINNAGVEVVERTVEDGQGGIRQEIVLNRAVANVVAKPGPAQKAVRSAGQLVRR